VFDPPRTTDIARQTPTKTSTSYDLHYEETEEVAFTHVADQQSANELLIDLLGRAEKELTFAHSLPASHLAAVFQLCSRALSIEPHYAEFFVIKGDALVIAHRFEEAIAEYDKAIRLGSTPTSVYSVKAYALAQKTLRIYHFDRTSDGFRPICDANPRARTSCAIGARWLRNSGIKISPDTTTRQNASAHGGISGATHLAAMYTPADSSQHRVAEAYASTAADGASAGFGASLAL
jgi:tetratricopeptide (TPR) repeat protein